MKKVYCYASKHDYELVSTSHSGKKYWICKICGYKSDWNPHESKEMD